MVVGDLVLLTHRVRSTDYEIAGPVHEACRHVVDKPGQCRRPFLTACHLQGWHQLDSEFWAPYKYISAIQMFMVPAVHVHARLGAIMSEC